MVNPMVERATSDMLIGPDWAMNIEICDVCNRDPAQAKDVVRGIKKRLVSRNPKVQLLALTLLETIVKNCGEMVHMHVAEKDLPHEMVKIVRKKPDFNVKEKILILIDTWQESFGGSAARYPQFIVAYQDLLRLGAVFPQRPENFAPIFTPAQTHPLTSYPQNVHNTESRPDAAESSAEAEFPTLSMTEIQNARGIMDVLVEMLSALGPGNKEQGIKQEVIVDLVEQCRTYKQRVVHLVNSTADESLLCEGLTLNDDLQRILAKHESIASGATSSQLENPKPDLAHSLPPVDAPLIDTGGGSSQLENGSTSGTSLGAQLSLPAPPTSNGQLTTSKRVDPKIDLLSGDDFNSPTANSLALVPIGEALPAGPVTSQQNALALIDMFPQSNNDQSLNSIGQQANPSSPQFHHQPNFQSSYPKGSGSGPTLAQFEQSQSLYSNSAAWNGQMTQQQQPLSPVYGSENSALPPPPWEAQLDSSQSAISQSQEMQVAHAQPQPSPSGSYLQGSPTVANNQNPVFGMYMQPMAGSHLAPVNNQANQMPNMYPHQTGMYPYPQPIQSAQMGYMYPQQMYGNNMAGYGYGYGHGQSQQANTQYLDQSMSGLSVRDENALRNSSYSVASPYVPSGKPSKPEDKLFADLVDISKFKKPAKTSM